MCSATVSISLPERLFQKLKRVADLTHRSVEEVAATSLEVALPADQNLPAELADELAAMRLFSDDALWAATTPSLKATEEQQLLDLNTTAGERDLSSEETAEQQRLIDAYQRSVIRRAQALAILAQRGHNISRMVEETVSGHGGS